MISGLKRGIINLVPQVSLEETNVWLKGHVIDRLQRLKPCDRCSDRLRLVTHHFSSVPPLNVSFFPITGSRPWWRQYLIQMCVTKGPLCLLVCGVGVGRGDHWCWCKIIAGVWVINTWKNKGWMKLISLLWWSDCNHCRERSSKI